jgi:CheY-like chemotaxis protein
VDSVPGVGSIFYVYLPAASRDAVDQEPQKSGPVLSTVGSGRLLLMDDEYVVRKVVGSMLERLGYDVVFASHGREAVDLFRKYHGTAMAFDAVILDLTIPGGLGGEETIRMLIQIDPKVRAIVSSGYSDHPVMSKYEEFGFAGMVTKPFRMDDLGQVLAKVIHK